MGGKRWRGHGDQVGSGRFLRGGTAWVLAFDGGSVGVVNAGEGAVTRITSPVRSLMRDGRSARPAPLPGCREAAQTAAIAMSRSIA